MVRRGGGGAICQNSRRPTPKGSAFLSGPCPERRCDLRFSVINTIRCLCLYGKSFLDSVVGESRHQFRNLPITFEPAEFAFRQQQRGASPAFAMVPLSPTLHSPAQVLGYREC